MSSSLRPSSSTNPKVIKNKKLFIYMCTLLLLLGGKTIYLKKNVDTLGQYDRVHFAYALVSFFFIPSLYTFLSIYPVRS